MLLNVAFPLVELLAITVFGGTIACHELGRRIGLRRLAADPEGARAGVGTVETAAFALVGLLTAFTFSAAAERFDRRRQLILEEANAISTAYDRLELLPPEPRSSLQNRFKAYLDSRLRTYRVPHDVPAAKAELAASASLWAGIWEHAVPVCRSQGSPAAAMLLLPALNTMNDVATARTLALRTHHPPAIPILLAGLCLLTGLFAGYSSVPGKTRNWMHIGGLALILSLALYLIIDLDYARAGLIRVEFADQLLIDLRRSMD